MTDSSHNVGAASEDAEGSGAEDAHSHNHLAASPPRVTPAGGEPFSESEKERWATAIINQMSVDEMEFYRHNPAAIDLLFASDPKIRALMLDVDALVRHNKKFAAETQIQQSSLLEELCQAEEALLRSKEKKAVLEKKIHDAFEGQKVQELAAGKIEKLKTESEEILEGFKNVQAPRSNSTAAYAPREMQKHENTNRGRLDLQKVEETSQDLSPIVSPMAEQRSPPEEQRSYELQAGELHRASSDNAANRTVALQEAASRYHDKRLQYHFLKALYEGLRLLPEKTT